MNFTKLAPCFADEDKALAFIEKLLWPEGPVCPHCGGVERIGKMGGKSTRIGTYKCYQCRKPFTVTVGPSGSAYSNYGLQKREVYYNEEFEHLTTHWPWNKFGYSYDGDNWMEIRHDADRMSALANNLLASKNFERATANIVIDGIDLSKYQLGKRVRLTGLDKWSTLYMGILHMTLQLPEDRMVLKVSNDLLNSRVWGFAELWRREKARMKRESQRRRVQRLARCPGMQGIVDLS